MNILELNDLGSFVGKGSRARRGLVRQGWSIAAAAALSLVPAVGGAQSVTGYREAVAGRVRAALRHPDKISFEWGAEPVAGWMAAKGKPRSVGELGCVAVLGKDSGGGVYEDRRYVVFVFDSSSGDVVGQVFTLNQLNTALRERIGSWFSHDPGCPAGAR